MYISLIIVNNFLLWFLLVITKMSVTVLNIFSVFVGLFYTTECFDEPMLNTDEAVDQSFPLNTLERNGNEVLDKQPNDNELVENKDSGRKTGGQPEEKCTVRCIGSVILNLSFRVKNSFVYLSTTLCSLAETL